MLALILSMALTFAADQCPTDRNDYFCLPSDRILNSEMDRTSFYLIPAQIIGLYHKELQKMGSPVVLDAKWESPYFGAGVSYYQNQFKLMILGGTARIEGMTKDAYAAVVCHELGHILGGSPRQTIPGAEWSSSEGQSDYFAATHCLPQYFARVGVPKGEIDARIEKAGYEMFSSFLPFDSNSQENEIVRDEVELPAVEATLYNKYPSLQCRYLTFRNRESRLSCWFRQ